MAYASLDHLGISGALAPQKEAKRALRRIGIVLFDGFSLLGAGMVAEAFHLANDIAASDAGGKAPYNVWLLSAGGGNVTCSSSLRVWTDGFDTRHFSGFDALYIAGGQGVQHAMRDERLTNWLRQVYPASDIVHPIAEGHLLLRAIGMARPRDFPYMHQTWFPRVSDAPAEGDDRYEILKSVLMLIKRDLWMGVARAVAERLLPSVGGKLEPLLANRASATVADKVRASARWLQENCERAISVADAAPRAAMSERNFLRRFKLEMGITPSEYLLQARLAMVRRLLADTELPVDKIARRCGMGNGDRLAKIFRKRLNLSPTEYRNRSRSGKLGTRVTFE